MISWRQTRFHGVLRRVDRSLFVASGRGGQRRARGNCALPEASGPKRPGELRCRGSLPFQWWWFREPRRHRRCPVGSTAPESPPCRASVRSSCWASVTSMVGDRVWSTCQANPTPRISAACREAARKTVKDNRSRGVMTASMFLSSRVASAPLAARPLVELCIDAINEFSGNIEAELCIEFANARRAGDVHFGQIVPDHVDPDEIQTAAHQFGADLFGDPSIARRQRPAFAGATGGEVAARFAGFRNARERIGDRFAVDDEDAFIAVFDLRAGTPAP